MRRFLLIISLVFVTSIVFAKQENKKAEIRGKVYEMVDGKKVPLSLANVQCKGTTNGTVTGIEGDFKLKLQEGVYKLRFTFAGRESVVRKVKVKKNKNQFFEVVLDKNLSFAKKK